MYFLVFVPYYVKWHYSRGVSDLLLNLKEGFLFVPHFFSLPLLLRTLFAPWKRLGESYRKGFDPGAFFSTIILNTILRAFGFIIRFFTILAGLVVWLAYTIFSGFFFIIWLVFPVFLLFILALAIKNLI